MASGHDVLVAPSVRDSVARDLTDSQLLDFNEAIDLLLRDPTEGNPYVTDAAAAQGYQLNDYVMVWGDLTITYRFLNLLVIEINAVRVLPRLSHGETEL